MIDWPAVLWIGLAFFGLALAFACMVFVGALLLKTLPED